MSSCIRRTDAVGYCTHVGGDGVKSRLSSINVEVNISKDNMQYAIR